MTTTQLAALEAARKVLTVHNKTKWHLDDSHALKLIDAALAEPEIQTAVPSPEPTDLLLKECVAMLWRSSQYVFGCPFCGMRTTALADHRGGCKLAELLRRAEKEVKP